jgi:hypothetical protein
MKALAIADVNLLAKNTLLMKSMLKSQSISMSRSSTEGMLMPVLLNLRR